MSEYKFYGIMDNWKDLDTENVVEVTSEDGSVSSVKVNGVEYGGGVSDFSTVNVTVVNNTSSTATKTWFPFIKDGVTGVKVSVSANSSIVFQAICYQGTSTFVSSITDLTLDGNISYTGGGPDKTFSITGDCTITIS